jgi:uncharacterized protein YdhG (YjbR/CyaY superfamily)
MTINSAKFDNIDEYISGFPESTRKILEQIRLTIKQAAPQAVETIKYSMPAFTLNGNLVYFAAFKNHIGLYPAPAGNDAIDTELSRYKASKGTLRFPIDKPIPYDLIERVVKLRVQESMHRIRTRRT